MESRGKKASSFACGMALFLLLGLLLSPSSAELPRFEHPVKCDGSLSFLVVGDWGRKGEFNQTLVAYQMGKIGEQLGIDFVISTGDNFYEDGLTGVDDNAFEESFTNIYTAESLQKQWYAVLGNHDYRGDVLAQLSPVLRKIDGRWLCLRSYILVTEIVDFFFVDTTPFVTKYWSEADHHYDWREVAPHEQYIDNLLKDLDAALKESRAPWRFVVGHHTMRSVSEHGDTQELLEKLLPILQENGVDLYINGHDHCLEHISSRSGSIQYLTSGGGSKAWRGTYTPNADELRFFYDGQGFMSMQVTVASTRIVFYNAFGQVLHELNLGKQVV
ncbi:hypothetical protein HPP92_002288 [Vanilla planifolia]|uniref:Purple acid phosphatase n=1 Tax=Vanilla planifolia TaxID=51239 RepID=A0A835S603_VANPL|nr:hypothetical protein HPP92_002288 [Vanilla planifolia]